MQLVSKYKLDHIAFWLITIIFYAFTRKHLIGSSGWFAFLLDVFLRNGLLAAACYLNIYFLFERYFRSGRYLLYSLAVFGLLILYTVLQNFSDAFIGSLALDPDNARGFFFNTYYNFSIGVFYLSFTLALVLSKRWYQQQLLLHRVQNEKLQAELQYLKAQLNPHFLFNCINTIYFQIDKSNADARASLEKFAELLRYQLYECNEDWIPIEKETSYLESYVDLQRLRKNSNNRISFETDGTVKNFSIPPLLLLPLVENAFKHLSTNSNSENSIELRMKRNNGCFIFNVINSINPGIHKSNGIGIGLKNTRRRLDLLYENKYKLDIHHNDSTFSVELQIEIP